MVRRNVRLLARSLARVEFTLGLRLGKPAVGTPRQKEMGAACCLFFSNSCPPFPACPGSLESRERMFKRQTVVVRVVVPRRDHGPARCRPVSTQYAIRLSAKGSGYSASRWCPLSGGRTREREGLWSIGSRAFGRVGTSPFGGGGFAAADRKPLKCWRGMQQLVVPRMTLQAPAVVGGEAERGVPGRLGAWDTLVVVSACRRVCKRWHTLVALNGKCAESGMWMWMGMGNKNGVEETQRKSGHPAAVPPWPWCHGPWMAWDD